MTGIEMTVDYLGMSRQRPPRAELSFDVHLVNGDENARWVLVPDTLTAPPRPPGAEVLSIGGWLLGAHGTVQFLHATADAGWFAVLLPPRSAISVLNLPLAWWGESPAAVDVVTHHVTNLRVDSEPIAGWLGLDDVRDIDATADAAALTDPSAIRAALNGTPHSPLQVNWTRVGGAAAHVILVR